MGKPGPPGPVKLFAGVLTGRLSILPEVHAALEARLGPVDYSSELIEFDFTDYYQAEMGPGLRRQFLSFDKLVSPDTLAEIKLFSNSLEQQWSEGGKRLVNLDPGYVNAARLVLASTKDFAHRIYIGQGIYAEVTLLFRSRGIETLPWTYPDFRSEAYQKVFQTIRERYLKQLAGVL
ncbi:MAG: DUF4416 family protein [Chloroflexi bacterium]|nr:DUF4416 family protein [Chloroflexota bacterium]